MKDTYYFPHDSNAREDPKIVQMRSVYGYLGYAWYWVFIETMREQENYQLSLTGQYVWNAFAMQTQCDSDAIKKFVYDCIDEFKLFKSDGEYFWSESLKRRMEKTQEKSEKARQSALTRWAGANAMRTQCDSNAIKKRKEKKRKENNTPPTPQSGEAKPTPPFKTLIQEERFNKFYAAYPRKVSKGRAKKSWVKLNPGEELLTTMLSTLEQAKKSRAWTKDNGEFIPHPSTWLNDERWDDIINNREPDPKKPRDDNYGW